MLKTKQNRKKIFNLVKLILFVGIVFLVYRQVTGFNKNAWKEFNVVRPVSFLFSIVLVFPNIWLAYIKWNVTLNVIVPKTSKYIARQSFFAGVVTGMVTPNMAGNFVGRFYYFDRIDRIPITLFTLLSNYAQFMVSGTFGWIAIFMVGNFYFHVDSATLLISIGATGVLLYLVYFFVEHILHRIIRKPYFLKFKETLKINSVYRPKILGLSFARYIIFTLQFSLVLNAFGEEINLTAIMAIWQVYLFTMLIPSLFFGKLGVRESIALSILTAIGMNEFSILFASLFIWFINSLSPALLGLVICKNDRQNA